MSSAIKTRLSNSYLIGEIVGMLFFGILIDRLGRTTGVVAATVLLVLGIVLATAAHGTSELGCGPRATPETAQRVTDINIECSG
jgi:MFS family permease